MIGDWEVTRTEDGIKVRADARDPFAAAASYTWPLYLSESLRETARRSAGANLA
jgi:hypothetical protein